MAQPWLKPRSLDLEFSTRWRRKVYIKKKTNGEKKREPVTHFER